MSLHALTMFLQAALPAGPAPMITPARLQAAVEVFAGQPALVDPRLLLPACARPEMAYAAGGRSVMVRCAAPEWRVFIPVGSDISGSVAGAIDAANPDERPVPLVRRGDRVMVEAEGQGFVVGMEAIADADSRDGRVTLRPANGGRRLVAMVDDDGRVRIRGLNPMVNRR